MSEPEIVAPAPAPKPRRSWSGLVVAGVIGVVVGVGAATLVWTLTSSGSDPEPGDEGDVATACSLVRRTSWENADESAMITNLGRWGAASQLATDVSGRDARYKPLADSLRKSRDIIQMTFKAEGPEFDDEVRKAKEFCADR